MHDPNTKALIYVTGHPADLQNNQDLILDLRSGSNFYDIICSEDDHDALHDAQLVLFLVTSRCLYQKNAAADEIVPYAMNHAVPVLPVLHEKYLAYDLCRMYGTTAYVDLYADEEAGCTPKQKITLIAQLLLRVGMQDTFVRETDFPDILQKLLELEYSGMQMREVYKLAVIWQSRCITDAKNAYATEPSQENLRKWIGSFIDLGDFLRFLGRDEEAAVIYTECFNIIGEEMPELQYLLYCKSGYAYQGMGNDEQALSMLLKAKQFAVATLRERSADASWDLYLIEQAIGDLYSTNHRTQEAMDCYTKLFDAMEDAGGSDPVPAYRRKLAGLLNRMAEACADGGQLAEAMSCYRKEIEIREEIMEEGTMLYDATDMFLAYERLGKAYLSERRPLNAEECYQKALQIAERFAEVSGSFQTQYDLAQIYEHLGDLYLLENRLQQAENAFSQCLVLSVKFFSESDSVEAQYELAKAFMQMGNLTAMKGDDTSALHYQENACETLEKLNKRTNQDNIKECLAMTYERIGTIYRKQRKVSEAARYYQNSLDLFAEVANRTGSVHSRRSLSVMFSLIGDLYLYQVDLEHAEQCYRDSIKICEEILAETDSFEARRDAAVKYNSLGRLYLKKKDLTQAQEYLEKFLQFSLKTAKGANTLEAKRDVVRGYQDCSDVYIQNGQLRKAKNYLDKAIELQREIEAASPTVEERKTLSFLYCDMSRLREKQHQFYDAIEYAKKNLAICEALAAETGSLSARNRLADALEAAALVCERYGNDPEETFSFISRSLDTREDIANETRSVKDHDALAKLYYNLAVTVSLPKMQAAFLQEAITIWEELKQVTGDPAFQEKIDNARHAIRYFQLEHFF